MNRSLEKWVKCVYKSQKTYNGHWTIKMCLIPQIIEYIQLKGNEISILLIFTNTVNNTFQC